MQVADCRVHGTTRQHAGRSFEERERAALKPLPETLFPCYEEARRTVHRDGCVEVKHACHRVPDEYIGREVWVRWDGGTVRVFNQRLDQIAVHARLEPGRFSPGALYSSGVAETADYWCRRAARIGPWARERARQVHAARGPESIRVLMGLWHLGRRTGKPALDKVCHQALKAGGQPRLRDLRRLLDGRPEPMQLTFFERHPLIRDLEEYGSLVAASSLRPELPTTAPAGFEGPSGADVDNSCALTRAGAPAMTTPADKETT